MGRVFEAELAGRRFARGAQKEPQHSAADAEVSLKMRKPETAGPGLLVGREHASSRLRIERGIAKVDYAKLDGMRHLMLYAGTAALCFAAANDLNLLPPSHLIDSKVVAAHLFAPSLPPGGVVGEYREQKGGYRLLLVRMPTNDKAAFLLLDIKKLMTMPHYLAHMGGFAGSKDGQPFYVFAKGPFVAAIAGKPESEADLLARFFAGRLPLK